MSGTEDSNHSYRRILPSLFVYNEYSEDKIKDFIKRQKLARQHLPNPWSVLLIDDCTDDPKVFKTKIQQGLYKLGRHWKCWYLLSLQYAIDIPPKIRVNIDGCFILRETSIKIRKSLWENYGGIIPDFKIFCDLMDGICDDFTALYIHNATQTNDWKKCVYWYKATPPPEDFKFGCKDYWDFHKQRYNEEYTDPY